MQAAALDLQQASSRLVLWEQAWRQVGGQRSNVPETRKRLTLSVPERVCICGQPADLVYSRES